MRFLLRPVLALSVLFLSLSTLAQDPNLVPAFGVNGSLTIDFGQVGTGTLSEAVFDGMGNIILIGSANNGTNNDIVLVKVSATTGALVTAFGTNGKKVIKTGSAQDLANAAIGIGDDIFIAGQGGDGDFVVVKVDIDGNLDSSFGDDGIVLTEVGTGVSSAHGLDVDGSGNIIVAGTSYLGGKTCISLIKLDPTGALIPTFGTGGKYTLPSNSNDAASGVAIDAGGNILATGYFGAGGTNNLAVVKLTANGVLDDTFGTGGKVSIPRGGLRGILVEGSGNIYAYGYIVITNPNSTTSQKGVVVKLNSTGTPVTGFGVNGINEVAGMTSVYDLTLDIAGNLVLAGFDTASDDMRLGKLDATTGGVLDMIGTSFLVSGTDVGTALLITGNGDIYLAGYNTQFHVAKYDANNVLINAFDADGKMTVDVGSKNDMPAGATFDAAGNLVIAGEGGQVAMIDESGALVPGFDTDGKMTFTNGGTLQIGGIARVDNNFFVAGTSGSQMGVVKIDGTGVLVPGFGTAGKKTVSANARCYDVATDAAGNVLLAGSIHNGTNDDVGVIKLDGTTGVPVASFGSGGAVMLPVGTHYDIGAAIALTSAGDIIIAGKTYQNTDTDMFLMKLDANGNLVTSFGTGGKTVARIGSGFDDAYALEIDSDGNIFVGGITQSSPVVLKFDANGTWQTDWGTDGSTLIIHPDFPNLAARVSSLVSDDSGNIYVGAAGGEKYLVSKLTSAGLPDSGYGTAGILMGTASGAQDTYLLRNSSSEIIFASAIDGDFLVGKLKQGSGLTLTGSTSKTFGDAPFTVSATSTSPAEIIFAVGSGSSATITDAGLVTITGAGTVTLSATQEPTDTYVGGVATLTLTIAKAEQTITFAELPPAVVGDMPVIPSATASSSLPVGYTSTNSAVAQVSSGQIFIIGAGTTTIRAIQAGNENYNAAPEVTRELVIGKKDQTITFSDINLLTMGGPTVTLNASASSALSVTYSSTSDKVSISGNQMTVLKPGRASVTAAQAGDENYNAAVDVTNSFCISTATPVITLSGTETLTLTSSENEGNQWYKDGTAIANATGKTLTLTEAGSYTVRTTVDDCTSTLSLPKVIVVTAVNEDGREIGLNVYPVPVHNDLIVEVVSATSSPITFEIVDMLGRQVHQVTGVTNERKSIDFRTQGPGMYVVRAGGYRKTVVKE